MVGIVKELGYRKIDRIWYKDPKFGMHVLADDKCAIDIANLCWAHLSVHVYIQHSLSHPKYYDDPIEEYNLNHEDIVNLEEKEALITKLYEEAVIGDYG